MNKLEIERINNAHKISKCLKNLNIHHIVTDGALLGFIREKSLIEWDWDIEISVRYFDFESNLINIIEAFDKLKIGRVSFNNSYENPKLTIFQNNFKYCLNAFHYSKDKKVIYRKMYKFPSKYLDEICIIKIKGLDFPIPKNSEDLLELEYGKNWRVPLKSFDKNEYKSNKVYTKKNNKLFLEFFKFLEISKYILRKFLLFPKKILSKYPVIEYYMNLNREQLFIDQLNFVCRNNSKIILVEIGSSDLKESLILSKINKNKHMPVKVYEASRDTYLELLKLKKYYGLQNIDIFNKAVIPSLSNYQLKKNISPNLNEMIFINKKNNNNSNNILLSDIREINDIGIHKLVKMDIEGLEEKLFEENLNYLKTLKNITFTIEMHQNKYKNPSAFEKVIHDLLNNQYSLLFIELSRDCNEELKRNIKIKGTFFKKAGGRLLIKNPDKSWVRYIVNTDYCMKKNYPYFARRNIRSISLTKSI